MLNRTLLVAFQSFKSHASNCFPAFKQVFGYQSEISLKALYPNSRLSIQTPSPPEKAEGKFNGYIPIKDLGITYSCSSGPGGQRVNKVKTKVQVQFNVIQADWIPEKTKQRLLEEHRSRINKDGDFLIKSDQTRSQQMNLADALNKLRNILWELEKEPSKPSEETLEIIRRRYERAAKQRLAAKRKISEIKSSRRAPEI